MWTILMQAFGALKAGERLVNVVAWKNTQATSSDLYIILGMLVAIARLKFPEFMPSDEILLGIAAGGSTIFGAINSYFTRATTTKIGV